MLGSSTDRLMAPTSGSAQFDALELPDAEDLPVTRSRSSLRRVCRRGTRESDAKHSSSERARRLSDLQAISMRRSTQPLNWSVTDRTAGNPSDLSDWQAKPSLAV
jgi:hypothetical protein